jgi:hypothetical protein
LRKVSPATPPAARAGRGWIRQLPCSWHSRARPKPWVGKAVELALSGDAAALRLCLDRLMPLRRDRVVPLALPSVRGAGDITAAMATIIAAVTRGKISPREGVDLAKLVDILMRAIETRDFDSRLRVLEEDAGLGP